MDLKEIHDYILWIASKEQTGHLSHERIDAALDDASIWRFNERWPFYAIDQKAQDDLAPFKKLYSYTNVDSPAGLITLPTEYLRLLSITYLGYDNARKKATRKGIEIVNDDEIDEAVEDQLVVVSASAPIAREAGKRLIQLYPQEPSVGQVWYMKRPDKPVFSYSLTGRTVTYDQGTSTQLEWDDTNARNIRLKALTILGIKLSNPELLQEAQLLDKQPE